MGKVLEQTSQRAQSTRSFSIIRGSSFLQCGHFKIASGTLGWPVTLRAENFSFVIVMSSDAASVAALQALTPLIPEHSQFLE